MADRLLTVRLPFPERLTLCESLCPALTVRAPDPFRLIAEAPVVSPEPNGELPNWLVPKPLEVVAVLPVSPEPSGDKPKRLVPKPLATVDSYRKGKG
jgi:hypothetical protein